MKIALYTVMNLLLALTLLTGCKTEAPQTVSAPKAVPPAPAQKTTAGFQGTVIETIESGGYTYVQVDTGSEKIWAAANPFQVSVGDQVIIPQGIPMQNFQSKTLDRTFDIIYFVPSIGVAGTGTPGAQLPEGHAPTNQQSLAPPPSATSEVDFSGLEKAEGGKTVHEILHGKNELSGKNVTVRGKVIKFTPSIMGKNWLHLQDGTGEQGHNDLTVTTNETAKAGDTVLVSGAVSVDKDFGAGYTYEVMIEDAKISVE